MALNSRSAFDFLKKLCYNKKKDSLKRASLNEKSYLISHKIFIIIIMGEYFFYKKKIFPLTTVIYFQYDIGGR